MKQDFDLEDRAYLANQYNREAYIFAVWAKQLDPNQVKESWEMIRQDFKRPDSSRYMLLKLGVNYIQVSTEHVLDFMEIAEQAIIDQAWRVAFLPHEYCVDGFNSDGWSKDNKSVVVEIIRRYRAKRDFDLEQKREFLEAILKF